MEETSGSPRASHWVTPRGQGFLGPPGMQAPSSAAHPSLGDRVGKTASAAPQGAAWPSACWAVPLPGAVSCIPVGPPGQGSRLPTALQPAPA